MGSSQFFSGKKALITGGSSGIGKAMAIALARQGAHVIVGARTEATLDAALTEIRAAARDGGEQVIDKVSVDVADRASCRQASEAALARLGGLDLLINNAGIAHPGYIQDLDDDVFDRMMQTNYFGTVYMTRAVLPHFMSQRSGRIVNVSSLAGFIGIFGYTAYAASKFAVCGFTDALRQELLPYGVGVSVAFPADTDTPQLAEENRIKPPETKAIAGNVKVMSAEAVAHEILAGAAAGKYHICPGFMTKFTHFTYRHFPQLVRWVMDSDLRKYQRTRV